MRSVQSLAFSGWLVVALLAVTGFAAFSPDGTKQRPPKEVSVSLPAPDSALPRPSARVAAFVLADALVYKAELPERINPPRPGVILGADALTTITATTTTTTTTTTTLPPPPPTTTTTTTSPPPPTTTTTTTTSPPPPTTVPAEKVEKHYDVEQWRPLVTQYFAAEFVEDALWIIGCESKGDPEATNPRSGAVGLFQFMPVTWGWASDGAGWSGADPHEPEANVAVAAWLVEYSIETGHSGGPWGHWVCRP